MANDISRLSDSELLDAAAHAKVELDANLSRYVGVTTDMTDLLTDAIDGMSDALTAHIHAQAEAKAKTADKEDARGVLEQILRNIRNVAKAGGTSQGDMNALGLPSGSSAAPSNATVPDVEVDTGERLRHTLHWRDAASQDNKRKPRGTMGAEIWVKIGGPPPSDEKDCIFLTLDAFTPYLAEYEGGQAGQVAHYMVRWRMRDGSVSGWSETASATITA